MLAEPEGLVEKRTRWDYDIARPGSGLEIAFRPATRSTCNDWCAPPQHSTVLLACMFSE